MHVAAAVRDGTRRVLRVVARQVLLDDQIGDERTGRGNLLHRLCDEDVERRRARARLEDDWKAAALDESLDRRLVVTWNFPPSLPALRDAHTLVTITLEPLDGGRRTRLTLLQTGWQTAGDWPRGRAFFDRAWDGVLARLRRAFDDRLNRAGG